MSSLQQLNKEASKAKFQVLKKIGEYIYIIGDEKDTGGLLTKDQILEENKAYQIIKPIKNDNVWETSSFKI